MPRDFEPAIGDCLGVYLYSIDDLQDACQRNRRERDKELPAAMHIVEQETARFMADLHHRATAPIIKRLREGWQQPKEDELRRLFNKLPELDEQARGRDPPVVRPAGQQAAAPAAGIAAQRSRKRPAARPARCAQAAFPAEGLGVNAYGQPVSAGDLRAAAAARLRRAASRLSEFVDNELSLRKFALPTARKMSFHIPIGLAREKTGRIDIGIFCFHAKMKNVPMHRVYEYFGQVILLNHRCGLFPHQSLCNWLKCLHDVVPFLQADW